MLRLCRIPGAALLVLLTLAAPSASQPTDHPCLDTWTAERLVPTPQAAGISTFEYAFLLPASTPPRYLLFFLGSLEYEQGRLVEETTRLPDFVGGGTTYVNRSRTTYAYEGPRLAQVSLELWEEGGWMPTTRTTFSHLENAAVHVALDETYTPEAGAWENRQRATQRYAATLPATSIIEGWDGTAWALETRCTVTPEDTSTVVFRETWDGVAWTPEARWRYALPASQLVEALTFRKPMLETDLFALAVPSRAAAEAAHTPYTRDVWNPTLEAWTPDQRLRRLTQSATTLEVMRERWNGTTQTWDAAERTTFAFDGTRVAEMLQEASTERGPLTAKGRVAYTYDTRGLPVQVETFTDNDRDGTLDPQASTRLSLTWVDLGTGTATDDAAPALSSLRAIAPSPSLGATQIQFYLATPGPVALRVFDALGREVALLADQVLPAGAHTRALDTTGLASGVYVVHLETPTGRSTGTLLVAR